jgi:alpha-D-ribose 1-methylphosphonate 5-triphosphate synthase subunit PhnG
MSRALPGLRALTRAVAIAVLVPSVHASSASEPREPWRLGSIVVTPRAEVRLRQAAFQGEALVPADDSSQARLRVVADARLNRHVRVVAEIGTGHVAGAGAPALP